MRYSLAVACSLLCSCFALRPFVVSSPPVEETGDVSITVSATPSEAVADGASVIALSLFAERSGKAVAGAALTLLVGGTGNTVSASAVETNESGEATADVRSTKAETKHLQVVFQEQTYDVGDIAFVPGPMTSGLLTCPRETLRADGNIFAVGGLTPATCSISALDAQANGVSGATFSLALSGSGNTLPASVQTNAHGVAEILISSTIPERKVLTATAGAVSLAKSLHFVGQWFAAGGPTAYSVTAYHQLEDDVTWVRSLRAFSRLNLNTTAVDDFSDGIPLDVTVESSLVVPEGDDTRLFVSLSSGGVLTRLAAGESRFVEQVSPSYHVLQVAEDSNHIWMTLGGITNGSDPTVVYASRQSNGTWLVTPRIGGLPLGYYVPTIVRSSSGSVFALVSGSGVMSSNVYRWTGATWQLHSASECTANNAALRVNNATNPGTLYLACNKPGAIEIFKSPSDVMGWTGDTNFSDAVFAATVPNLPANGKAISMDIPDNSAGLMVLLYGNDTEFSVYTRQLPSGSYVLVGSPNGYPQGIGSIRRSAGGRTTLAGGGGVQIISAQAPQRLFGNLGNDVRGLASTVDGTVFVYTGSTLFKMTSSDHFVEESTGTITGALSGLAVDGNDVYLATSSNGMFRRRSGVWSACNGGLSAPGMPTALAHIGTTLVADIPGEGRRVVTQAQTLGGDPLDGVYFLDPAAASCAWTEKTNGEEPTFNSASLTFGGGKVFAVGQTFDNPGTLVYVYENGAWTTFDPPQGDAIQSIAATPDGKLFLSFGSPPQLLRYDSLASTPVSVLVAGDIAPPLLGSLAFDSGDLYASPQPGANRVISYRLRANQVASAAPRLQAITLDGSASVAATSGYGFTRIGERLYAVINVFGTLIASVSDGD